MRHSSSRQQSDSPGPTVSTRKRPSCSDVGVKTAKRAKSSKVGDTENSLQSSSTLVTRTRISYTRHTTNESVRNTTGCLPVSERVKSFRLRFFGHLARSNPEEDHDRVIAATLRPPSDWRRPAGRPRTTWLRSIGEDLQSQNFGVHTAWRKAKERDTWHQVVSTATLC